MPKPGDSHPGTMLPLDEPAKLPSCTEPVCTAPGGAASYNSKSQFGLSKVTLHFQGPALAVAQEGEDSLSGSPEGTLNQGFPGVMFLS